MIESDEEKKAWAAADEIMASLGYAPKHEKPVLISSAEWKEDKPAAVKKACAVHLRALFDAILALRDENGHRPDFDMREIVDCIHESMVLSRAEFEKYDEMLRESNGSSGIGAHVLSHPVGLCNVRIGSTSLAHEIAGYDNCHIGKRVDEE